MVPCNVRSSPGIWVSVLTAPSRNLLETIGGITPKLRFVTEDWTGYHWSLLEDQLFTGKDMTYLTAQISNATREPAPWNHVAFAACVAETNEPRLHAATT